MSSEDGVYRHGDSCRVVEAQGRVTDTESWTLGASEETRGSTEADEVNDTEDRRTDRTLPPIDRPTPELEPKRLIIHPPPPPPLARDKTSLRLQRDRLRARIAHRASEEEV